MLTVEEARERVLARFQPLPTESIPLTEALGRVLAEDALAQTSSPPFANSAMDGYALRSADVRGATTAAPVRLRLVGEVPAGSVYPGVVAAGEAVRILTGAPLPNGADAALQQELTEVADGWVTISAAVEPETNVRHAGEDARPGMLLARAGTEIGPAEIALLAALGVSPVRVSRRPRVAILATGDELVPVGQPLQPGQIYNSNTPYLIAAVTRAGADPVALGIAPDREEALREKLAQARQGYDLILTSGGVSVGDYDLVKQLLNEQGAMEFWRVRMRPGKPLAFGALGETPLLGLPGNPVSAAVTFELFGRPAIRRMLGAAHVDRPLIDVVLEGEEQRRADRRHFVRVRLQPFFHKLVAPLAQEMGSYYGELKSGEARAAQVLAQEEIRFAETLATGMALLDAETAKLTSSVIPGETVFKLYDTYGFPADLTADIARERGLSIDQAAFDVAMEAQRGRARAASKFGTDLRDTIKLSGKTNFSGYDRVADSATVTSLIFDGALVDSLRSGQEGQVVLDHTPFYAESGGQIGDTGFLSGATGRFVVRDTQKIGASFAHVGELEKGELRIGDAVDAQVDQERRKAIALNHSATHLLHAALRKILGKHVEQKGSLVAADRLRFDFSHTQALSADELRRVEDLVNSEIRENAPVETRVMALDQAKAAGAMSLFGEKYDSDVRVLSIGDFSMELCGGTHVQRAGDIGLFKITGESGVAAGVRRVEALTGRGAYEWVVHTDQVLRDVAAMLRGSREDVDEKVRELVERSRRLEKEIQQLKSKLASGHGGDLASSAKDVGGIKVLAAQIDGADVRSLRDALDKLKDRLGSSVIVLAGVQEGKVLLVAGVSQDLVDRIKAGEVAGLVAAKVGGRGGGRADFAQAGGTQPENLAAALAGVEPLVRSRLSN